MSDYVSEGGHWYDGDGKPAYTQEVQTGKNKGKERPTTIRDAKKLSLVPSVTTLLGVLDKPALTHWKIGNAVDKALCLAAGEQWVEDDSAAKGTLIHGAIEHWIETGEVKRQYAEYIDIVKDVMEEVGVVNPVSERSFSTDGYGGAIDMSDPTGDGLIIDFKTKDIFMKDGVLVGKGGKPVTKLAYDEHIMQLAAYRVGIGKPQAKLYNLFLSRIEPSTYVLHEWEEEEAQRGWEMFNCCFNIWKLQKRWNPCT